MSIVIPQPIQADLDVIGFTNGKPGLAMVRCESNEEAEKLMKIVRPQIDEAEHHFLRWNSVEGVAYFKVSEAAFTA
jgi:hypothetical protein